MILGVPCLNSKTGKGTRVNKLFVELCQPTSSTNKNT